MSSAPQRVNFFLHFKGHSIKFGSFGDETGELSYPCYVAVNDKGHIVVSDMHSHKIQVRDTVTILLYC